jgi:hypothetical protein
MRYISGGTLAGRLEREHLLPVGEAVTLMTVIAATLDFIHEQRVIHRDLKPGNILLDGQGIPYLADFGLARNIPRGEISEHTVAGTLMYMSPEQLTGAPITTSADLFSFGVLLHVLFSGELPYGGEFSLGAKLLAGDLEMPDITRLNPRLPPEINIYLWQLTMLDPAMRIASAGSAARAIAALFQDAEQPVWSGILGTGVYHERETQTLVGRALSAWREEKFTLSLTEYIALNEMLRDSPSLVTPEVCGLMLRGALQYQQDIAQWWVRTPDEERRRACWHALNEPAPALRALTLATPTAWATSLPADQLDNAMSRLDPTSSEVANTALPFLERVLPVVLASATQNHTARGQALWTAGGLPHTERYLSTLAASNVAESDRAATLIGDRYLTSALNMLLKGTKEHPQLVALEAARAFPPETRVGQRLSLTAKLAVWQLTRQPTRVLYRFLWTVLGCVLAMGTLVYVLWRSPDLLGTQRLFNTLGLGLLFGLINGTGVWLARHLARRLRVMPFLPRAALGSVLGGLVVAGGFALVHHMLYQDEIAPVIALSSGILFVAGIALGAGLPPVSQIILGAIGVMAAYLIPWVIYVNQLDFTSPPFYFMEDSMAGSVVLAAVAALLVSAFSSEYRRARRPKPQGEDKTPRRKYLCRAPCPKPAIQRLLPTPRSSCLRRMTGPPNAPTGPTRSLQLTRLLKRLKIPSDA